ncbi:MAG: hypothetical protein SVM80_03440 [Halobacteriota archaeon]|nr:hypothetical protein [Halobacteriota archaeon]
MDEILLVAGEDGDVRENIGEILKKEGFDVVTTKDFEGAKTAFEKSVFGTVIFDIGLPKMDVTGLCLQAKSR